MKHSLFLLIFRAAVVRATRRRRTRATENFYSSCAAASPHRSPQCNCINRSWKRKRNMWIKVCTPLPVSYQSGCNSGVESSRRAFERHEREGRGRWSDDSRMTNADDDFSRTLCCLCFASHSLPPFGIHLSSVGSAPLLHVFLYIKWLFQVQCQICGANYCIGHIIWNDLSPPTPQPTNSNAK